MLDRGPISPNTHGAIEPLVAIVIGAAPWIFGFSEVDSATTLCVVVAVAMLAAGAMTRWRPSILKLIPLRIHFGMDLAIGLLLVLSPFIFGFSDEGGATRFVIIAGVAELLTALGTRWNPEEAERGRGTTSRVRPARV
jgi:hypothetical protein